MFIVMVCNSISKNVFFSFSAVLPVKVKFVIGILLRGTFFKIEDIVNVIITHG